MEEQNLSSNRRFILKKLMCLTIGLSTATIHPNNAIERGAFGSIIVMTLMYFFIGIPFAYLELVISQFTGRDCIDVWKIFPLLSHIGYLIVFWQFIILVCMHTYNAFALHYLFASMENTPPFYQCGPWSNSNCEIIESNYTVFIECLKGQYRKRYCSNLYYTYSEYQYFRYKLLRYNEGGFHISGSVVIASVIVCVLLFICCFKKERSFKWFLNFINFYPVFGYFGCLVGSMLQRGLVTKFREVIDAEFELFLQKFNFVFIGHNICFTMALGCGLTCSLGSNSDFRASCYNNMVLATVATAGFSILTTLVTAMMYCPYCMDHKLPGAYIAKTPITIMFEKMPRMIKYYEKSIIYLFLYISSNACISFRTTLIVFFNLQDLLLRRIRIPSQYPGITCAFLCLILFLITIPFMSFTGIISVVLSFRRYMTLMALIMTIIESCVFVFWYGIGKLCEDIHFMSGVRPSNFVKISWLVFTPLLMYILIETSIIYVKKTLYRQHNEFELFGMSFVIVTIILVILPIFGKMLYAKRKGMFRECWQLDPTWGPKSEILRRSRGMFTAQAMTKEYLYRQYNLQAGVMERQKRANVRDFVNEKGLLTNLEGIES